MMKRLNATLKSATAPARHMKPITCPAGTAAMKSVTAPIARPAARVAMRALPIRRAIIGAVMIRKTEKTAPENTLALKASSLPRSSTVCSGSTVATTPRDSASRPNRTATADAPGARKRSKPTTEMPSMLPPTEPAQPVPAP